MPKQPVPRKRPAAAVQVSGEVRKARERAKLSQVELAARIGTRQGAVTRLERGPHNATIGTLEKVAKATGSVLRVTIRKG
ncbi:MAG: helix-turn-helix transcriptional regulator [Elusimicrobia bacterium]|nr:helix-turn-helix transcriptional regulator [Elusimicrobiota bacterium]